MVERHSPIILFMLRPHFAYAFYTAEFCMNRTFKTLAVLPLKVSFSNGIVRLINVEKTKTDSPSNLANYIRLDSK